MSGKNRMGNRGFTLVEVMLSIAILALISVPLMKYFADSLRYSAQTAEKQKATMIAQETIEYIRSQKKIVLDHDVTTTPAPVVTAEPDPDAEVDPDVSPTPEPTPVTPVTRKTYYLAPELTYLFGGYDGAPTPDVAIPEGFANTGATLDATGALESMVYRYIDKRSGKYLVEVSMNCMTPAYEVDSPAIMQIDDRRNVVIAERSEVMDAITHFSTLNINQYMAWNGGYLEDPDMTPEPTPDEYAYLDPSIAPDDPTDVVEYRQLSEAEIRANMDRIIYVTITKGVTDTKYTVSAYYQFFCKDVFGPGTDSDMEYPSASICETTVETLEGIFLMFNKMNDTNDYVQIEWNVMDDTPYPDLRFVIQDDLEVSDETDDTGDDETTEDSTDDDSSDDDSSDDDSSDDDSSDDDSEEPSTGYKLTVDFLGFTSSESTPSVHSNLGGSGFTFSDVSTAVTKPGPEGQTAAGAAERTDIPVLTLTGEGVPVRLFDITVKVYANEKAYDDDPDNPLIELKTTKVE